MKFWAVYKRGNKTPFALFRTQFEASHFVEDWKGYSDVPLTTKAETWISAEPLLDETGAD